MMAVEQMKTETIQTAQDDFLEYGLMHGFGDIHFKVDSATGMKAIVAIHSTKLGPALGGCRFIEYAHTSNAIYDAMRLARGMSYKAALVNLPLGGGKSVIIKPTHPFDRETFFHSFGQFVNDLGGRYITALDSGTQLEDMDIIAQHTPYVASLSKYQGDPSPYTASGIVKGIEAAVEFKLGKNQLSGLHIAIQGLGHVGYALASQLHERGVRLTVADVDPARVAKAVAEFECQAVSTEIIHQLPCDVFSPCALGGVINDISINQLQTSIIAGAANNQLAHEYHGAQLHQKGILYAVDYIINAGGLIFAASKYLNTATDQMQNKIQHIADSLQEIFRLSVQTNRPTSLIADSLAQEKLA